LAAKEAVKELVRADIKMLLNFWLESTSEIAVRKIRPFIPRIS